MNLYVAGAALGATASAALAAVWILGPGGSVEGIGSGKSKSAKYYDVQIAPYVARMDYQGGSSALVPISVAFRVRDKESGLKFCKDLGRVQREVKTFMGASVGRGFSWKGIKDSGLDKRLAEQINRALGANVVERVFMAAGDQGLGSRPATCARLSRL